MRTERTEAYLLVDGKPFYLRGGEIHYFRLRKEYWRHRIETLKETHMNTVSSYMPWFWHEPEEGKVDLEGKTVPERDLRGFLEICADAGVKVIARPGPFVNSELREGGYPRWVFEKYPVTLSRRRDGHFVTGRPAQAEGEPVLRNLVRGWYGHVVPLLAEFSCAKGGPIILFQPDNELSAAWSYGLGNSLYDDSIIGENGLWHGWLKKKYGGLENLSERYGRKLKKWADILPPRDMPGTLHEYRVTLDWMDFKRDFFADWGITLCRWTKEFGLDLPFTFNEPVAGFYTHGDHPGFSSRLAEAGIDGFTTCHTYSDRIYDLEGANNVELAVEITKSPPVKTVPMSLETNNTWFEPRLSRNHINMPVILRMGLAHGLNGSNIYAFAEGRNPEGTTLCGLEYWEDAAVAIDGKLNPCHGYLENFYGFVSGWEKEILATEKVPDVYIGISPSIRYIPFLGAPVESGRTASSRSSNFEINPEPGGAKAGSGHEWLDGYEDVDRQTLSPEALLWKDFTELMILLRRMNIMCGLVDMTHPRIPAGKYTLIVPNVGFLEKESIDYILDHIESSGRVLFFNTVPCATSDGYADTRLTDKLKVRLTGKIRPAGAKILDYGWRMMVDDENNPVGQPSWIRLHESRNSRTFAWFEGSPVINAIEGTSDRVIVSGIGPSYHNSSHLRLWKKVFSFMGVKPQAETDGDYMNAVVRRNRKNSSMLVSLCNITGTSAPVRISLGESLPSFPMNCRIKLAPCEARMLWVGLPLAGNVLSYITHEIVPAGERAFEVRGGCGDTCEFAFEKSCKIKVDGEECVLKHEDNIFVGTFVFRSEKALLAIS